MIMIWHDADSYVFSWNAACDVLRQKLKIRRNLQKHQHNEDINVNLHPAHRYLVDS